MAIWAIVFPALVTTISHPMLKLAIVSRTGNAELLRTMCRCTYYQLQQTQFANVLWLLHPSLVRLSRYQPELVVRTVAM
jgi:hypothetical protein